MTESTNPTCPEDDDSIREPIDSQAVNDSEDSGDDDERLPPRSRRPGHYDRPKDVKRREEMGDMMARFNWAARARGLSQTDVSLKVGTNPLRFNRDVNVVVKHGFIHPYQFAAYQAVLGLSVEFLLAEDWESVPEERRLVNLGASSPDFGTHALNDFLRNQVNGSPDHFMRILEQIFILSKFSIDTHDLASWVAAKAATQLKNNTLALLEKAKPELGRIARTCEESP